MLLDDIKSKNIIISIIGLGYVGLPLSVEIAKAGYQVVGIDIDERKVNMVNKGISYIKYINKDDLQKSVSTGKLKAVTEYKVLDKVGCVIVCVPTPLDRYKQPDITFLQNSVREISKYMHEDMLIILESTTYPGTTEDLVLPILESSGLKCGEDFYLAYSPERIDPGNKNNTLKTVTKLVGGITNNCRDVATTFYETVLNLKTHKVSNVKVSEMAKLLENTYRYINIALANEMAIICDKIGIDVWEVIQAASTKGYGFQPFYPGIGIGGHCIPVDPIYLMWKVKEYDYNTKLINIASEINNFMPYFVIEKIIRVLNSRKKTLKDAKVLVVGVAYKKEVDDLRESPALKLMELLLRKGAIVEYYDPYIEEIYLNQNKFLSVELTEEKLHEKDIVIITTGHKCINYKKIVQNSKLIFDFQNVTADIKENRENIIKL